MLEMKLIGLLAIVGILLSVFAEDVGQVAFRAILFFLS